MLNAGHDVPFRRAVAGELISDHDAWRSHLLLQQLAQQPLGSLLGAAALDQDIEHDAALVQSLTGKRSGASGLPESKRAVAQPLNFPINRRHSVAAPVR